MFTGDRVGGQSQEYQLRGGVERECPFSPLLGSCYVTGQGSAHHQGPAQRVPPWARGREVESRRAGIGWWAHGCRAWGVERGSLEGDLIQNGGQQNEATEPWCLGWISSYWGAEGAAPETGGTETYSSENELGTLLNPPTSFPSLYSVSVSS